MRRWTWIGCVAGLVVLFAAAAVTEVPELTPAETDAFVLGDVRSVLILVHSGPAGPKLWERRCTPVLHPPNPASRQAAARLVARVKHSPHTRLSLDSDYSGFPRVTIRQRVRRIADDIAECRRQVADVPAAWREVEAMLREA